ncbi:hypothetical protein [Nocardioides taihuensis]|uniref:Uncharacterized protein n=1 Tax=Nocardioides taihuensis TaxID=1835606 RepID=A0ABW0BQZ9_9ACTN
MEQTRTSLHGVAELLLAGPQHAAGGGIRLRVVPGGFATVAAPDLRVAGEELAGPRGSHPLRGTYAEVGGAVGVVPRRLDDVYTDGPGVRPDDRIELDPAELAVLLEAFVVGDAALRQLAPRQEPVLWPEHFDVGIAVDEVNFGVSPGDAGIPEPYAYVGPWTPRTGDFWDQPFGAARPVAALGGVDGLLAFFREGAARASDRAGL